MQKTPKVLFFFFWRIIAQKCMSYDNKNQEVPQTPPENLNPAPKEESAFGEIVRFALIALIIVLPVRWFIAQPFIVSGASMEETFKNNEYLIVDQLSYRLTEPARGEVIVFRYPNDPSKYFIKRIIGLPGETIIIENNNISIKNSDHPEGMFLSEPYAQIGKNHYNQTKTLGNNEYFVMGDNRDYSSDSRIWGTLDRDKIIGRALIRLFPPNRAGYMPGKSEPEN